MKQFICYACILCWIWTVSCSKDLGNYTYRDVNEISISTNGAPATVFLGDTLKIVPGLSASLNSNESDYSYRWVLQGSGEEISAERNLDYRVTLSPGSYGLDYYLTDNATGLTWQTQVNFEVITPVYEGFLVLSEVNGSSRLDMLSYRDGNFVQYTDVLKQMGSALKLKGKPIKVSSLKRSGSRSYPPPNYAIYILTDQATNQINPETFGWTELDDIRYRFLGNLPQGFKADNLFPAEYYGGSPILQILSGGKLFISDLQPFSYLANSNVYAGSESVDVPIAPKIANSGVTDAGATYFDTEHKVFVTSSGTNYFSTLEVINQELYPEYPRGMELVDMFNNYYGLGVDDNWNTLSPAYAIVKDPATSRYSLLRFYIGFGVTYFEELDAPDIRLASHFAASPELDYLFYSVGGKVYEYDMALKTTKLMLDFGASEVTLLTFTPFFSNSIFTDFESFPNANYAEWGKWLTVGAYDPAKPEGNNGSLGLYSVPPVNQPLVKRYEWTGFGKIASVCYRER